MSAMTKISTRMALVYHGPGRKAFEAHAELSTSAPSDAIVKSVKPPILEA